MPPQQTDMPGALDGVDGVETVLKRVGGDDLRVEFRAGVEVVVVGGHAGGFELLRGLVGELAECNADLHAELADFADGFENGIEGVGPFADAFPSRAHAEAGRAVGPGAAGDLQDFVCGHEVFSVDACLVAGALGAVGAILAATPRFDAQEGAELDFVVLPMLEVDVAGLLDKVKKRLGMELLKLVERVGTHVIYNPNYLLINSLCKNSLAPSPKSYKNRARIASTGSFCYRNGLSMDKVIQSICGMLQSPDGMRRCAAAMVIAELKPKQDSVVKALGDTLKDANQLLTRYVLEAFEAIGTRAVVPYVLPLLEAPEIETKLRAAAIIANAGGDNVSSLRDQFLKASPQQKRVLVDILARIHNREAMQLILDVLFDTDFELVKETCQAVRRHIGDAEPKKRAALHRQIAKFMTTSRVKKNDRVLTSCLLLIGYVGASDARKVLLKYSTAKNLGYIRRNALIGLKGLPYTGAAINQMAGQMLKYLGEADYPNVVQNALDIIEKLPLGKSYDAQWRKLLKSKHPSVRAFAARKLATNDNPAGNRLMMNLLAHADTQVSEIATGALPGTKAPPSCCSPRSLVNESQNRHGDWRRSSDRTPSGWTRKRSRNSRHLRRAHSKTASHVMRHCCLFCATSTRRWRTASIARSA